MSRWTMLCSSAAWRADAMASTMTTACSSESLLLAARLFRRLPPSTYYFMLDDANVTCTSTYKMTVN